MILPQFSQRIRAGRRQVTYLPHKMFGENAERDARTENSGLSRPPPNTRYCRRL
jgi:hypothetical protein